MLPLSAEQIKSIYDTAMAHLSSGRLDAAEELFRQVKDSAPGIAEAPFQLARIALIRKDSETALGHLKTAIRLKPGEPALWHLAAEALATIGDPVRNRKFLESARGFNVSPSLLATLQSRLSVAPGRSGRPDLGTVSPERMQAVMRALDSGRPGEAEQEARALSRHYPGVAPVVLLLANSLFAQGKMVEARAQYLEVLRLAPTYPEAHTAYGRFLIEAGEVDAGLAQIQKALRLAPDLPLALQNMGIGLARRGEAERALAVLQKAVAIEPRLAEAQMMLGRLIVNNGVPAQAVEVFRKAINAGHSQPIFYSRLAEAMAKTGDEAGALQNFDEAIRRGPDVALLYSLRAMYLEALGRFDDAERDFRKAIALEPRNGEHYRTFLSSYRIGPEDPLLDQMERYWNDLTLPEASRMHLGFALSRAMEQIKRHDRVFAYLDPANALMRARYPYDIGQRRREIDALKAAFDGTDWEKVGPAPGASDFAPIFVTGMPRSGTTLVEQILSSHSRVAGGGEVGALTAELMRLMARPGGGFRPPSELAADDLVAAGRAAEKRLRALCPGALRITDKAIQTYLVIGLIRMALPNAHVVLVRRDPRDTLLSIYKNVFAEGTHRYAYDQRDLGLYYRLYEEIVDFWRARLPGSFHEIQYEDLIENPEAETRKLVAACGLPWEDSCLKFHENTRKVATLSVAQVRQPIYRSSQAAWKRHEHDLATMIESLGDLV